MNSKKTLSLFLSLVLLVALSLGVVVSASASDLADKMFQIALTAPFTGFDPLRTNDAVSTYVNAQMYETLYRLTPENEFVCLLAEELPEFAEDGMSATIKLRQGVTFHDGTPFNAEAVKYTLELIKDPDFGSLRASIVASIDSIEILDEYTIRLNLTYEDGVLLAKLAHTNSAIVSPTAQAAQDLMIAPVGTGPYKFVSSVSGAEVVLTRNDDYWGPAPVIKDITMTIIAEESTAIARMETGEADFMPNLTVEQIDRVMAMPNVTFESSSSAQITYVMLRPNSYVNPIMGNKDFRTAIAKALDTEGYTQYVMEGYATHAKSIIGPQVFGYTEAADAYGIAYDPEGAKAIIEANGWGNELINLLVPSTPVYTKLGEFFQSNLQAAGFTNVQIEMIDWSAWLTESMNEDRFDISLAAWSNVTRDGTELLEPNWESKVSRRAKINNDEFDQLVLESKTTSNREVRLEKLDAANKLLMEEVYVVPVYNSDNLYCYNSAYDNVKRDVGGTFYVKDFTIK